MSYITSIKNETKYKIIIIPKIEIIPEIKLYPNLRTFSFYLYYPINIKVKTKNKNICGIIFPGHSYIIRECEKTDKIMLIDLF